MKWNKKLTDKSWIPEEDVRKQAQKAMKGTEQMNSFQIICKINEQILVSLVEWAKGKRFKTRWTSSELSWSHFDLYPTSIDGFLQSFIGSLFFQDMSTNDQMSLLHETWSELVLLDHIYRQVWFSNQENILLVSGESVSSKFYLPTPILNNIPWRQFDP